MATAIIGNQKHKLKATIVEQLPDKGVSNKIYYVPNKTKGNNKYDEYVWLKDTEHPNGYFEKVGQKDIDLEPYALKEWVEKNYNYLKESVVNLGHYDTEADAINYLKTLPICADTKIIHAHLTYGDKNNPNTITVIQNVTDSWTRQVLFRGDKVQQRAIYFTNNERTEIRMAEDLQPLFGDRLKWDSNAHKYILSQFGAGFNADYTDPIPIASSTSDGLISKEDKVNLDDTSTYNYIGTLNSWNKIAKLTTESTEADILNTLTITPIRGNAPTTKQELFAILDKCAIHKKFLRESSTNSHVFVNHIGSCYVIYILGNKASALNGKLVGTLILRSITITANTNETLAVLKNPLEINLEDINKKVGDLEAQVKDLTNRIATLENK